MGQCIYYLMRDVSNRKGKKWAACIVLILSLVFLFLSATVGLSEEGGSFPSNVLFLPSGARAVLIDKSKQRLFLLQGRKGGIRIEKQMVCATGRMDGDKEKAGDKRTPEGIYFCSGLLLPPRLGSKYGICALPLNYPNLIDRRRHRDGGGIWIHGIHSDRTIRSTQGCVVLQNDDLSLLARGIHLYTTPVVIAEHVRFLPEETLKESAKRVLGFLKRWRDAWASGDINAYMFCYGSRFFAKGMNLSQWRDYKSSLFKRYNYHMVVKMKDPLVIRTDNYDVISFRQAFHGVNFSAVGYKRLYLCREGAYCKIIGEEWIPLSVIKGRWSAYKNKLAFLKLPAGNYRIVYAFPGENKAQKQGRDPYKEARYFINRWKNSWEKRDTSRFASFYSKHFRYRSMDFKQWKRYKYHTFIRNGPIRIVLKDMKIQMDGNKAAVRFYQIYQSRAFKDKGMKELVLCRESGGWKILSERWYRSR